MRATSASRLDTCAVKALRSAAAKVGSSFANTSPALTCWPLAHLDRAHDRRFQRLHQDRSRLRDRDAVHARDLVDRDQPHRCDHHEDEAGDHPHRTACRARDRRIDDRRRRPLEFEDRRRCRVSPTPPPHHQRIGRRFAHDWNFTTETRRSRSGYSRYSDPDDTGAPLLVSPAPRSGLRQDRGQAPASVARSPHCHPGESRDPWSRVLERLKQLYDLPKMRCSCGRTMGPGFRRGGDLTSSTGVPSYVSSPGMTMR